MSEPEQATPAQEPFTLMTATVYVNHLIADFLRGQAEEFRAMSESTDVADRDRADAGLCASAAHSAVEQLVAVNNAIMAALEGRVCTVLEIPGARRPRGER